ncbi:MAG: IS1595 family transposase [Gaiellaceae bacterium]
MPPVDRNNPVRANSSDSRVSFMEFVREFPDDAACLEHLWRTRYAEDGEHAECPRCEQVRSFKRYETTQRRQSWTCTACGHHVHPTAGTIFHKSSTSLHLWFYAIYLMSSTRCGISAKQLEREIGVNYKTAHRMLRLIRSELMAQDDTPLTGEVEVDETYMGGKARAYPKRTREQHLDRKTPVFGAVERSGRVRATVMNRARGREVWHNVHTHVLPASMLFTDDSRLYDRMTGKYRHHRIKHQERIYVSGNVHTQTIEGFFALVKNGIRGTHHSVSSRHLPSYLNEYAWRYNHRDDDEAMFRSLLDNAATPL